MRLRLTYSSGGLITRIVPTPGSSGRGLAPRPPFAILDGATRSRSEPEMAKPTDPSLVRGQQAGATEDGSIVELSFVRLDGSVANIRYPAHRLGDLLVLVQEAGAMART